MALDRRRAARYGRILVWVACLLPVAWIILRAARDGLGANPIEELTHWSGDWTLNLLVVTLAVTPLRRLTGWNGVVRYRRTLGLFAAFYAALHFSVYVGLDRFFAFGSIIDDVKDRPYITVGFTALVLLVPLAVTSTQGWIRRLGRWWRRLHRLVYVAAVLGVLHYLWLVKADTRTPLIYAAVLALLLALRLRPAHRRAASGRVAGRRDLAVVEASQELPLTPRGDGRG